jgi:hypothetical protein
VRIIVYATLEKPIGEPDLCAMARRGSADHVDITPTLTSRFWRVNLALKQAGSAGLCSTGIWPVESSDTGWKPVPLRAKEFVVDRFAQGKTAGDLPKNCHLLPPTAIYGHFGAAKPLRPLEPLHSFVAPGGHAGLPAIGNCLWAHDFTSASMLQGRA